jgi:hypothetical protein
MCLLLAFPGDNSLGFSLPGRTFSRVIAAAIKSHAVSVFQNFGISGF